MSRQRHVTIEFDPQVRLLHQAVLLHELNHRINNEYASAISAMSLAAAHSGNEEVKLALDTVNELLHSYAEVHRALQCQTRCGGSPRASFPSGHATLSAITYLTISAVLARSQPSSTIRLSCMSLAAFLTVLIGVSRIYLGVHYPTDVLAGWCIGAAWAMGCWAIMARFQSVGQPDHLARYDVGYSKRSKTSGSNPHHSGTARRAATFA
jgi:membrane-associated phospholipid phosphatase